MARTNKPTAAELMAQQAEAAQQEPQAAIDSYITQGGTTDPDEALKGKKKLRSFYCDEYVYAKLSKLARYRAVNSGQKNERGQGIGAGTLINESAAEYLERHMTELQQWEMFERATERFFEPENLERFMAEQKRLSMLEDEKLKNEGE